MTDDTKVERVFETWTIRQYALVCRADWIPMYDCPRLSSRADFKNQAIEMALEEGWRKLKGKWCCPAHVESYE